MFSKFPSEEESVLLPGTQLEVINVTIDSINTNLYIAHLMEVKMLRESKFHLVNYFRIIN